MSMTIMHHLLNEYLPDKLKFRGSDVITKKLLNSKLTAFAKENPALYARNVAAIKTIGDDASTYLGVTIGVNDIVANKRKRDKILDKYRPKLDRAAKANNKAAFQELLVDLEAEMNDLAIEDKDNDAAGMILSGGRGKAKQLAQINAAPIIAQRNGEPMMTVIDRNFSEGLSVGQTFLMANQSRMNQAATKTAVPKGGDLYNQLWRNMMDQVITIEDCGTSMGKVYTLNENTSDDVLNDLIDRYLVDSHINSRLFAKIGSKRLIDRYVLNVLKSFNGKVLVRSPMYCAAKEGLCSKCYGVLPNGKHLELGENIGVITAQSLASPITQMTLNSKHGGRSGAKKTLVPTGLPGAEQLITVPAKNFKGEAVIAKESGIITRIEKAPQGGYFIYVNNTKHYAEPQLSVQVHMGQKITDGDQLTDGLLHPRKVVAKHGLSLGREHYANALSDLYKNSTGAVDGRLTEVASKSIIRYVRVKESDDDDDNLIPGDLVPFDALREKTIKSRKSLNLARVSDAIEAVNKILAKNTPIFKRGEKLTAQAIKKLKSMGINNIEVVDAPLDYDFEFISPIMAPSLQENFMAGLASSRLQNVMRDAVLYGKKAPVKSLHPVAGLVSGTYTEKPDKIKY